MTVAIARLDNPVRRYPWGSRTDIPALLGLPTQPEPWAEVWMGTHPSAVSRLVTAGSSASLAEAIAAAPDAMLGPWIAARYTALPFLLKVLAAARPLSLQAHPNAAQAREGFAREDRAGIPRDAPHRCYRDDNAKPELFCALTPCVALQGFREPADIHRGASTLGSPALRALARGLAGADRTGLRVFFEGLLTLDATDRRQLVAEVVAACRRGGDAEARLILRLNDEYPDDIGALAPLYLNLVHLAPGQALYLPAGDLHTYVEGMGIEIMASSDNVLRGGLTPKHIDTTELLRVLTFRSGPPSWASTTRVGPCEVKWDTPAAEFRLSRLTIDGEWRSPPRESCDIVLVVDGALDARSSDGPSLALARGQSAFVPAVIGAYRLRGVGTAFRATVPRPSSAPVS